MMEIFGIEELFGEVFDPSIPFALRPKGREG